MERYLAHIRRDGEGKTQEVQTVGEHQRKAAEYAAAALEGVSLGAGAYLAGLVHDTGKYTARYQDYLAKGKGKRGTVNHSFAGVRLLLEHCHGTETGDAAGLTGELLSPFVWGRGLKYFMTSYYDANERVALCVGARIEISGGRVSASEWQ